MQEEKGIFAALFDFSISHFITPRVLSFLYGLSIVLLTLGAVAYFVMGIATIAKGVGILFMILAVIMWVLYGLWIRVGFETIKVIWRVRETLAQPVRQAPIAPPPHAGVAAPPEVPPLPE